MCFGQILRMFYFLMALQLMSSSLSTPAHNALSPSDLPLLAWVSVGLPLFWTWKFLYVIYDTSFAFFVLLDMTEVLPHFTEWVRAPQSWALWNMFRFWQVDSLLTVLIQPDSVSLSDLAKIEFTKLVTIFYHLLCDFWHGDQRCQRWFVRRLKNNICNFNLSDPAVSHTTNHIWSVATEGNIKMAEERLTSSEWNES